MKATTENLKANRTEVINILTSLFGQQNLKSAAAILANKVEYAELFEPNTTIEECIESIDAEIFENRKMKLADYVAALSDNDSSTYAFSWTAKRF
ncbi:MAG TPA: hypothetical protein VFF23_11865 [Hanamia sp.]|nr:hypothetical protein [Hanamia sp.]